MLRGEYTEYAGREIHTKWVASQAEAPVPIYIAAEGPKTLELAGEVADGVICGMGLSPEVVKLTLEHLAIGAERAGKTLEDLDIWTLARINMGADRAQLIEEIRMELASTAHHAFRFTLDGKLVPPQLEKSHSSRAAGLQANPPRRLGRVAQCRADAGSGVTGIHDRPVCCCRIGG